MQAFKCGLCFFAPEGKQCMSSPHQCQKKEKTHEMILIPFCNVSSCICRLGLVTLVFDSGSCHSLCDSCNESLRDMHLFAHVCFSLQRFLVSRNSILEKNAARLCNIQPHHHVLEVGFGPGIGLQHALQYVQGQLARLCVSNSVSLCVFTACTSVCPRSASRTLCVKLCFTLCVCWSLLITFI